MRVAKQQLRFQHTAARRRLGWCESGDSLCLRVSTHSRPKAAGAIITICRASSGFQHTAARRRLGQFWGGAFPICEFQHTAARRRLASATFATWQGSRFQHTAARRRLVSRHRREPALTNVSTHSRPKAAGCQGVLRFVFQILFQHTAARRRLVSRHRREPALTNVSTHSRPKAAGCACVVTGLNLLVSTHSRPKAAGNTEVVDITADIMFQHTAARRRLALSIK